MLNIAVIDDNEFFVKEINRLIKSCCVQKNIICNIDNYFEGLSIIETFRQYHLIFLDIDMPMINGISVCEQINKVRKGDFPYIVFVTSKDNLVFNALKNFPYAFIRKSELSGSINECIANINNKVDSCKQMHTIKDGRDLLLIDLNQVIYLVKNKNYIFYHTTTESFKERNNIDKKESELKEKGFIRVHSSYIVNAFYIEKFETNHLVLCNKEKIAISKKYKCSAKNSYYDWLVSRYG